jgi:hypothetical protein
VLPVGPLRTRAGSIAHYTTQEAARCGVSCRGSREAERGAGEEERRRDEGTGDGAKEVARTAGGKAAGARVIGG